MTKIKKPLKTIKETPTGRNLVSVNTKTGKKPKNPLLIEKVKQSKLPGYEVVKPKKKAEYLRSKSDKEKRNNLDPKIKVIKKR